MIWICTVCKDRVYPGSVEQGLIWQNEIIEVKKHCAFSSTSPALYLNLSAISFIFLKECIKFYLISCHPSNTAM